MRYITSQLTLRNTSSSHCDVALVELTTTQARLWARQCPASLVRNPTAARLMGRALGVPIPLAAPTRQPIGIGDEILLGEYQRGGTIRWTLLIIVQTG